MVEPSDSPSSKKKSIGWVSTLLICALIASAGAGLLVLIYSSEPEARRSAGTKKTAMLVDVISADTGTYRPLIDASGEVVPAQEIVLRPRVQGEILERANNFTPGDFVNRGDTLLLVDPSDYQATLQQRKSTLAEARAEFEIEKGNQAVAQYEYESLGDQIKGEDKSLVLREPQLKIARSNVESAEAAVKQAQLNLQRTTIKAPFNAHILSRNVNVGSQVSPGDNLARLVGYDTYWVETTVPLSKLRWLSTPDTPGASGSEVTIRNQSSWPEGMHRTGHLHKLVGELEEDARMARVLINVEDPLARADSSGDSPPLVLGSFVETRIQGIPIKNVVRLEREYVRDNETVWVMQNGELDIRDITVVFQNEDHSFIREGLSGDERIVTTNLSTVVDGAPLRTKTATTSDRSTGDTDVTSTKFSTEANVIPTAGRSI